MVNGIYAKNSIAAVAAAAALMLHGLVIVAVSVTLYSGTIAVSADVRSATIASSVICVVAIIIIVVVSSTGDNGDRNDDHNNSNDDTSD